MKIVRYMPSGLEIPIPDGMWLWLLSNPLFLKEYDIVDLKELRAPDKPKL